MSNPAPEQTHPGDGPEDEQIHDSPTGWVAKHIAEYVATDGQDGHLWRGVPTLLLTTRGRKSGQLRRTALIYGEDAGRYLVVGSVGGRPKHPAWYLNLLADPNVGVQILGERFEGRARPATADERPALWAKMVEIYPSYDEYQGRTERQIPVVIIERS